MLEKTRKSSGADEKTPSLPQYFSWVNNTNEGSTESQTLINLAYFRWLNEKYGMKLRIYAWDAGNLDGASGTYGKPGATDKLTKQYPNGYKPLADAAAQFGCHLGVWGGADGFGNTPEEEAARYETIVSLCRDLGFMEFKFDTVCGSLRAEKRDVFKRMIDECRKYVPELIVLNHRNELGDAEICATTFLWGGLETYIDVHIRNEITGSHHRVCTLERGLVPGMLRLTEDHGVCLSSCLDYFEDDLIMQGFARSLILAPEIYGNPWLLRDREQEHLAKIYTLHAKYRDILVNGMVLPESYGKNAVSRGSDDTRLIVLNNSSWEKREVSLSIGKEIGLAKDGKYIVKALHPYEKYIGTFSCGECCTVTVEPCRAALILVEEESKFLENDFVLTGAEYETVTHANAEPDHVLIYKADSENIGYIGKYRSEGIAVTGDTTLKAPVFLGDFTDCDLPSDAEALYEATAFRADSDSLEAQCRKRSGETKIPEVKAARDAFFAQDTYRFRGCESAAMFDGNSDTYFDGESVYYGSRLEGGCLRIDLGEKYNLSRIEIECFSIDEPIREVLAQHIPEYGSFSADLTEWNTLPLVKTETTKDSENAPVVMQSVHNINYFHGKRITATYSVRDAVRYIRIPTPMDRIYSVRFYDENGNEIFIQSPHANNMLAPEKKFSYAKKTTVTIPSEFSKGSYIACAVNGEHGVEGAYCAAKAGENYIGCNDRACSFPVNHWEHVVGSVKRGYTYYIPLDEAVSGKQIDIYTLFTDKCDTVCKAWLCDSTNKEPVCELKLSEN